MEITTPVGRIVWGHPVKGRPKTDRNTRQPILKDGKPVTQWAFGVAFNKAEFAAVVWPVMSAVAQTLFPSGQFPPTFAWKYDDGDGVDGNGKPFRDREGYAGCIVLAITTEAFGPNVVRLVNGVYMQVTESEIKTGDFVRVNLDIQAHGPKQGVAGSPSGLYINPRLVEFVGQGPAIINGPDPSQVFGGQAVALPPGATPIGSMPQATGALPVTTPPGQAAPFAAPAPMQPAPAPFIAPVAAPPGMPPAATPAQLPGEFSPAPTVSPSNPAPAPYPAFVQQALQAPPAPVAPAVQTPQYTVPAGSPIPAGYRYIGNAADGQWLITTP